MLFSLLEKRAASSLQPLDRESYFLFGAGTNANAAT